MMSSRSITRNLFLKSFVLAIVGLLFIGVQVHAACDGVQMNKKKTKVSIKSLKNASDACGGGAHLIKNHVGKSDSFLKKRSTNLSGGVASSFANASAARKAVAVVLKSNISKVKDIMEGKSDREEFRGNAPVKGTCVNKACPTVVSKISGSEKVFVLLRAKGSGEGRKVRIQTAFPEVDCKCP